MPGPPIVGAAEALGGTDGPSASTSAPASAENGTERASRTARVLARLATMRCSHVPSEERPSKRSMPRRTPSQASCTTSSATARSPT